MKILVLAIATMFSLCAISQTLQFENIKSLEIYHEKAYKGWAMMAQFEAFELVRDGLANAISSDNVINDIDNEAPVIHKIRLRTENTQEIVLLKPYALQFRNKHYSIDDETYNNIISTIDARLGNVR